MKISSGSIVCLYRVYGNKSMTKPLKSNNGFFCYNSKRGIYLIENANKTKSHLSRSVSDVKESLLKPISPFQCIQHLLSSSPLKFAASLYTASPPSPLAAFPYDVSTYDKNRILDLSAIYHSINNLHLQPHSFMFVWTPSSLKPRKRT